MIIKHFGNTVKPNFSNKIKTGNIILLDDGKIISENTKIVEVFNDYFINIVKDLQIPDIILAEVPVIQTIQWTIFYIRITTTQVLLK